MVQGSNTQLASEVKMKRQRRFPPFFGVWNLFRRLFLRRRGGGVGWGVTNLCISQFQLRPCPYSSMVAPGVGKCAAENLRRPCSRAPCGLLFTLSLPQADYEQRDIGIRLVLFSKKEKENRLKQENIKNTKSCSLEQNLRIMNLTGYWSNNSWLR